eukprot:765883-Hanusia_phi.AAC.3
MEAVEKVKKDREQMKRVEDATNDVTRPCSAFSSSFPLQDARSGKKKLPGEAEEEAGDETIDDGDEIKLNVMPPPAIDMIR